MDVFCVERLTQHIEAHQWHQDRGAPGDHRLVLGRRLERQAPRPVRFHDDHVGESPSSEPRCGERIDDSGSDALDLLPLRPYATTDQHMPVFCQHVLERVRNPAILPQQQAGRRALHLPDKYLRGHSRDHGQPGGSQFLGQPEHDGRLPAPAHQRDDIARFDPQRVRYAHGDSPSVLLHDTLKLILTRQPPATPSDSGS